MFCSSCGTQVNGNDKFCGGCGGQVGAPAHAAAGQPAMERPAASPRPTAAPVAKKKGPMPLWLKIVIGVVAFIILIVWVAFTATAGVVKTVDKHLALLTKKDFRGAYEQTTSRDFRDATSYEAFMRIVQRFPALTNTKKTSFSERSVNTNGLGTVKGVLTAIDGTVTPVIYTLTKENGEWKIINFTVNPSNF